MRLAIDDFGTGYSSLAYLQRFPVHAPKVDRSFVQRLAHGRGNWTNSSSTIVRAMVSLAANLGLAAVAEGIETGSHLE